jgi:hypothetical protein
MSGARTMKKRGLDSVESKVIRELKGVETRGRYFANRYTPWTKSILKTLAVLGRSMKCKVYTSKGNLKGDPDAGEWLYDQVWMRYDRYGYMKSVPLVLESELGTNKTDRLNDFCKLIIARADHRVMVFGASDSIHAQGIVKEFVEEVEYSKISCSGDRYLFAGLLESDGSFYFRNYIKV